MGCPTPHPETEPGTSGPPARSAGAVLARKISPVTVSIHSAEICARRSRAPLLVGVGLLIAQPPPCARSQRRRPATPFALRPARVAPLLLRRSSTPTAAAPARALPRPQSSRRGWRTAASPRRCTSRAAGGRRHPPRYRFYAASADPPARSNRPASADRAIATRGERSRHAGHRDDRFDSSAGAARAIALATFRSPGIGGRRRPARRGAGASEPTLHMQFAGSVRVGSRPAYGEDRDSAAACAALADVGVGAATGERFPAGRAASAGTGDPASISGLSNVLDSLCVQKKGRPFASRPDA
jgi:hypothetical protein